MEANSTGGQGSRRAVAPNENHDDDDELKLPDELNIFVKF
jgi:hypothetical protein